MPTFYQKRSEAIVRSDDECVDLIDVLSGRRDKNHALIVDMANLSSEAYNDLPILPSGWKMCLTQQNNHSSDRGDNGLRYYACYKCMGDYVLCAIAFRGTRGIERNDWRANLHWVSRYNPFQKNYYQQLKETIENYMLEVEDQLTNQFKLNVKFVTTGHSLGGGLAQFVAYWVARVKLCFAFDSTPVTGYFSVPKKKRESSCNDLEIIRIYEFGEALAYLRAITQLTYNFNFYPNITPKVTEIRTNLTNDNPIKAHGMNWLAKKLKGMAIKSIHSTQKFSFSSHSDQPDRQKTHQQQIQAIAKHLVEAANQANDEINN